MTVLYEDKHVVLDDDAMTIFNYYFPMGSKRIPYYKILGFQDYHLGGMWSGRYRLWGTMDFRHWFNFDPARSRKNRLICLETGEWFEPTITPEDPEKVLQILRQRVPNQPTGQYSLGQSMGQGKGYGQGMGQGQMGQGQGYGQGQSGQGFGGRIEGSGQISGGQVQSEKGQGEKGQISGSGHISGGKSGSTP